jgi:glycosyltransferase involved in cell wall biosynthesis
MSWPVFSVVIPTFNYGRYLAECLDSVFAQEHAPEFEVIVFDDGSTDDTRDVLARYADPRLRVAGHRPNRGHVATINAALPMARGSIVSRIDPDDRYHPRFMATVQERLRMHPEAALVYGRARIVDEHGRPAGVTTGEPHQGHFTGSEFVPLLERNFICAPTVAARRDAWLAHLPVPEGLAFHDWYFTLLISRQSPFHFVDEILADYRVHGSNHHSRISRDGSEEQSVRWLLDRVYAERESDQALEHRKRQARRRVYAAHYLDLADKYFGFGLNAHARRCYLSCLVREPARSLDPHIVRRLAATLTSRRLYEQVKALLKTRVAAP